MVIMKNLLVVGTLALSLFSSSPSWSLPPAPAVTTAEVPELSARILLDAKKFYSKGEEVILKITLENTGTRPLRFRDKKIEFFYDFDVTAGGKKIEPSPDFVARHFETPFSHIFDFGSKDKKEGYIYLSRAFDLSKEGLYTVTVSTKTLQPEGIFTITSQPFEFKVAGAPSFGYWEEDSPSFISQPETPPAK